MIPIATERLKYNLNIPYLLKKKQDACTTIAESINFKPALRMTPHEAESEQGCNEQSPSASRAPISPALRQKPAEAAVTQPTEHHRIDRKSTRLKSSHTHI